MANGLLNYYNQNGLLQDPSANIARQMTPQMQFRNPLLGMDLSPRQPTFGEQARTAAMGAARGLGNAFTGEGSSARLAALGASLLAGPSRTPISFGSSMAQGLLAGNVAAQQEEERKFKRGLLEQEMDYKMKSLAAKESKDTLYNVTQIGSDGEPFTFTVNQNDVSKYYNDPSSTITKVGAGSEVGGTPTVLSTAAKNLKSRGGSISKDTVLNDDGTVTVLEGSKTQQDLKLDNDKLILDKKEFDLKVEQFETEKLFKEREIAIKENRALSNDTQAKLDYDIANYNFKKDQKIDERKESAEWQTVNNTARKIRDLRETVMEFGPENVLGPMSFIKDIPIIGASRPAGQVALKYETLQAQLTKSAMDDFRALSKAGATGFGALNEKELKVLERYVVALSQAGDPEQQMKALDDLQNVYDSLSYGVIVNGKYENYSPLKHRDGLDDGSIIPATKENEKLIGVPTSADIPALKGATFMNRNLEGGFVFKLANDKLVVVGD